MEMFRTIIQHLAQIIELHVIHRIEHIRISDVFDIALISVALFLLVKYFWDKRGARLFRGLLWVTAFMIFTWILDMKAMVFIFSKFYQVGIIAIIIMFQPELRLALENIGNAPISNIKHITNDTKTNGYILNTISTITETACALSMEKTGALIVIERETKLGEHIKTGTVLNAQISSQLLKNIFFNKAPLHDGAVIVRNFRLYSAGCFLPLSMRYDIDENLGTRHRAAIGITEVSDAIVIVVSEENGIISIAHKGQLKQNYNFQTLKAELSQYLLPNEEIKPQKRSKSSKKSQKNKENKI
ncbi:MAG: diadenylate cyclase CdaA [Clostridia bacterium]|nr:diadenylate cyclase CdaA [Clostridia bacterium]